MFQDMPATQLKSLEQAAKELLKSNTATIDKLLVNFLKSEKYYTLHEASEEFILSMRRESSGGAQLNVGFPFPLHSVPLTAYEELEGKGVSFQAFLRGEKIRQAQRTMLLDAMGSNSWKNVEETNTLRSDGNETLSGQTAFLYFDPYDFVGDSIIGLYFADAFRKRYPFKDVVVFSQAHNHLRAFCDAFPRDKKTVEAYLGNTNVAVIPDMIDNQWGSTLGVINQLSKHNFSFFIPGRNILVKNGPDGFAVIHYNREDVLLRNQNIEDYMKSCLKPFFEPPDTILQRLLRRDSGVYFINPFGSIDSKDLPFALVANTCRRVYSRNKDAIFYIAGGFRDIKKHSIWVDNLLGTLSTDKVVLDRVEIRYFDELSQMSTEIKHNDVSAALTADTSIAHVLNRLGVGNITVYSDLNWDSESVQSMSSESPLGFCRFDSHQYPVVVRRGHSVDRPLSDIIADGLIYISSSPEFRGVDLERLKAYVQQISRFLIEELPEGKVEGHLVLCRMYETLRMDHYGTPFSWVFDSFNPMFMTKGLLNKPFERIAPLLSSCWNISPLYKICISDM